MGIDPDKNSLLTAKPGQKEIELIKLLRKFSGIVSEAASDYSPALVANYCYDLSKEYNQFYHDFSILGEKDKALRDFRIFLSEVTSDLILNGMWLLGIEMPERM
jgi:arginyl-tRNA synthetase